MIIKLRIILVLIWFVVFTESCNRLESALNFNSGNTINVKSLTEISEYIQDESNGFAKSKQIGDLTYTVNFLPPQLISNSVDSNVKQDIVYQYYNYTISYSKTNDIFKALSQDMEDYDRKIQYASFYINKDFYIVQGVDTLPCVLSHFERNYGLNNKMHIQLAFKNNSKSPEADRLIVYDDKLFSNGKIIFTMKTEILKTQFTIQ